MEPYRVFISSIMNASTEDLLAERNAAKETIESFQPIATVWAFEAEPASPKPLLNFYLDGVKESDAFLLILGDKVTEPVKLEIQTAVDYGKPILAFCKKSSQREESAALALKGLDRKYDSFGSASELSHQIRQAFGMHILALIRGTGSDSARPLPMPWPLARNDNGLPARLDDAIQKHPSIRIEPLVPPFRNNSFSMVSKASGVVTLEKHSNLQTLTIPEQRIEDYFPESEKEACLMLNGRLQWITLPELWRFFPEKPPSSDPYRLGFTKAAHVPDQLKGEVQFRGYAANWVRLQDLTASFEQGYQVFYDEDGRCFTKKDFTKSDMVWAVKRP